MVFHQLSPSLQLQSFFNGLGTSFEQTLAEFYNILLEEPLQVAVEMLEVGIRSSL
jgi:hypothetical protein